MGAKERNEEARLADLLRRGQEGDAESYHRFLEGVTRILRSYVRRRVMDGSISEEIVQELLIVIHGVKHTYHPARPFGPWFFAVVRHRFIDEMRKRRRVSAREFSTAEVPEPEVSETCNRTADLDAIEAALAGLPDRQRRAVELLKIEGVSTREAASRMQMSAGALRVLAHRAYKTLRAARDSEIT